MLFWISNELRLFFALWSQNVVPNSKTDSLFVTYPKRFLNEMLIFNKTNNKFKQEKIDDIFKKVQHKIILEKMPNHRFWN